MTLASPDNPSNGHPRRQQAHHRRLAPERRHAQDLQLRGLSQPQAIKGFEDQYQIKIEVSTFNDGDEAITKLRSPVDFDIYNANYTEISRLVNGGLLRPLTTPTSQHQERVA